MEDIERLPKHLLFAIALCVLLSSFGARATAFGVERLVVAVLDGDTLEVLNGHHTERIRLYGIDCPEKGQPYGNKAKQALAALTFRKTVMVQEHGYDQYKRTIGDVLLPDGTNVNHELVKDGWCWWYRKYAPSDEELEKLEMAAREARKGLWADPSPVPPWEWRRSRAGRQTAPHSN